jgi:hypothetical protein
VLEVIVPLMFRVVGSVAYVIGFYCIALSGCFAPVSLLRIININDTQSNFVFFGIDA